MAGIGKSVATRIFSSLLTSTTDVPKEAEARVARVDEDGVPWVAVAGSDEETPANGSVLSEASVGQLVRVSVQGGKLSIVGNASSPSVGGTYVQNVVDPVSRLAEAAMTEAQRAHDAADVAEAEATRAHVAAEAAQGSADDAAAAAALAQADATAAGTAAASAQASATQAIGDAAAAKSAADAAQADATAAGQAAAAAQGSADAAQASATRANTAATDALTQLSTVQDVVGTVEWAAAHSGEDMASYISSHLALTDAGLWVTLDSSGYRLLVSATGVSVVDPQGHTVSTFGESVRLDSSRPQYIGGEDAFIAWYDSDDDGVPDSLWIGGTSVTVGSKTLSELLGEVSRASADATEALADSVEYVVGTQSKATGAWTGATRDATLRAGKTIAYKLPYAGSGNATLELELAGGGTTGAIAVYTNTTRVTTHFGAGAVINMTYDGTYWRANSIPNTNNVDRTQYGAALAAAAAIPAARLAALGTDGRLHLLGTAPLDMGCPPLYVATAYTAANVEAGATRATNYSFWGSAFNVTATHAVEGATPGATLWLTGTVEGTTFTPSGDVLTCAEPTSADGLTYMRLGTMSTATNAVLAADHPLWAWSAGGFRRVEEGAAIEATEALETARDVPIVTLSSTNGTVFKRNVGVSTTIIATVFTPGGRISDAAELRRRFGAGAYLEWGWRDVVTDADHVLPSSDPRIIMDGFGLVVGPEDIDAQAVITCSLNY